jgi:hypothetical protein
MMIFLAGVILADFLAVFTIHDGDMTLSGRRRKRANRERRKFNRSRQSGRLVSPATRIDLTPNSRESVLYRYLSMFMSRVISACVVYHDVFVRWNRQPNVDLKAGAVTTLVTGCDHFHAATGNTMTMGFEPLYFT